LQWEKLSIKRYLVLQNIKDLQCMEYPTELLTNLSL
jgi:hypothetical protein